MNRQAYAGRIAAFVCALLALTGAAWAKTVYVNPEGKADYVSLRAAVEACRSGDIIVLEPGVYFGLNNQDITFSGKALTVSSHDPNDPAVVADTIIDCQGGGLATHYAIGALGNGETRLTLAGLTICNGVDVFAGGAVRSEEADLDVINCVFRTNTIDTWGGAVYCRDNRARFIGCTFTGNTSKTLRGGALRCERSQVEVSNCTFENNNGSALDTGDCQVTVTGCTFQRNKGQEGGAIRSQADTNPQGTTLNVTRCTFTANSANTSGGALYNHSLPSAVISACAFTSNAANQDGGAIYNYRSSPTVASCLFVANGAREAGGGLGNLYLSSPTIVNCTFVTNEANTGGAVAARGGSSPFISHCILWNNTAPQGRNVFLGRYVWSSIQTASARLEYSNVEGGRDSAYLESGCELQWASGNITANPLFSGPTTADYHLSPDSPCVDAGDPKYTPKPTETDLDGRLRLVGPAVDMGAFESQGLAAVYRFWSPVLGSHFYTISGTERDTLIKEYPDFWQYEDIAYYAFRAPVGTNLLPVYRFWSLKLATHFWTISEDERRALLDMRDTWEYEGIAFYAYPPGRQALGTLPVYRFWSPLLLSHFYTISESEKDVLLREYPAVWQLESVAWYAYAQPHEPGRAAYAFTGGPAEAWFTLTLSAVVDGKEAQLAIPDVKLSTAGTSARMTIDFAKLSTTLESLGVETTTTNFSTTVRPASGSAIPLSLSIQASFDARQSQGPFSINPATRVFADFTKNTQNIAVKDPVFKYRGTARLGDQTRSFEREDTATRLELENSGTFEGMDLLPEAIHARMPFTFQWHRQYVKDLLVEASVGKQLVQIYVTYAYVGTQGLWKGKIAR
ncbi:MAG: hypothetical protein MUC88_15320 [Planctomycetes bacterium]|jgi:predicted outer membrane repeat protein|nr:hypothetical protein [Planctomycetota bacterium]